jgi:hypothetical protein
MMPTVKDLLFTFGAAVVFALWIWFSHDEDTVAGGGLPLLSKLGFGVAAGIFGVRFLQAAVRFSDRTITHWLLRSAGFGTWFFIMTAIMNDTPLPSRAAIGEIAGAVVFGLVMGFALAPKTRAGAPTVGSERYQALRIIAFTLVTVVLALAPILERKENVLFTLILAMGVATPGADRWSDIRWYHWASVAIGTAALLTGLFAAR